MFTRFREAWRAPRASAPEPCRMCPQLREDLARARAETQYWRGREERTVDRLLETKGLAPTAATPIPLPMSAAQSIFAAMGVTEIDSSQSPQPGQDAMTSEPHR